LPAPAFEAELLGAHMQVAVEVPQNPAPDWTHEAVFASERQSAARARWFVSSRLVGHRLLKLVDPVRAVTSELSANAIVHARTPSAVTLSCTGPVVLLRVQRRCGRFPGGPLLRSGDGRRGLRAEPRRHPQPRVGVTTTANHSKCVCASFDIRAHGERGWFRSPRQLTRDADGPDLGRASNDADFGRRSRAQCGD
jgi:hypothetical protein